MIIALVVTLLGGTSIMGGFGSILCAVAGAFILGIVSSSVNMLVLVLIVTLARAEE